MTKIPALGLLLVSLVTASIPLKASADTSPIANKSPITTRYQKAIAPYIVVGISTYPDAKKRYLSGLPRKEVFYVFARVSRVIGLYGLATVKVTNIDNGKSLIYGRVQNDVGARTGYNEGDDISFPESDVIDWKITHLDGADEGNGVGKYIASLGSDTNVSELLADERDADLAKIENSKAVENALGNSFLMLFDDKDLKVEIVPSNTSTVKEWPSLTAIP